MGRQALGKGLSALIREPETAAAPVAPSHAAAAGTAAAPARAMGAPLEIAIELVDPSPYQPRTHFSETALEELAQSIRSSGIIQPLVLRPMGSRYQLIAGERRWRAAQRAGLVRVPAILREVPEELALELTLIENIQREDLNPIEQARAFERLTTEFRLTQEEVASRTGKDRATVANAMRLLKLEARIVELIEEGKLTAGHGRALLAVEDPAKRFEIARRAARGTLTVRQVERLATRRPRAKRMSAEAAADANVRAAIEQLQQELGTRVHLKAKTASSPGQIIIEYYDEEQLMGLYERLMRR